jgi:hypothetical protein
MDVRLLVTASLCLAGLAGCTAVAESGSDGSLMTASDALDAALKVVPDGELIGIHGVEGAQPKREASAVPLDDELDDGTLGDGRLSAWVVTFASAGALVEVRVHADGREPLQHTGSLPAGFNDRAGATDGASRELDSDDASDIALAVPEFTQHLADYPAAGFSYSYLPYGRQYPVRDWSSGMFRDYQDLKVIGWTVYGNTWSVVHYDPNAWVGNQVPTTAVAQLDAATGKVLEMTVSVPRTLLTVFEGGKDLADPLPPAGLDPYVHRIPFTLPPGTASISGILIVYPSGIGANMLLPNYPVVRIVAPDGGVAMEGGGDFGFDEVEIADPAPGDWTIEVTHPQPVPGNYHLDGFLWATVPLQP